MADKEIIIDVSNCSHKSGDDCMKAPICNEYGDLMGYQSCEAQTLCLYRSQKKIEHLEQENEELKKYKNLFLKMKEFHFDERINNEKLLKENEDLKDSIKRFVCQSECLRYKQYQQVKQVLEKIRKECNETPMCNTEFSERVLEIIKEVLK